ncbi:MAG: long-chain fatty acid--CoA ligase, partial [Gammaproteobacteria bacterium]|nr:long-chain fatty acid--CoA ligase [Gammaproteobacteria bacterium]
DRTSDVIEMVSGLAFGLPIEEVLIADFSEQILDCSVIGVSGGTGKGQQPIAVVKLQSGVNISNIGEFLEKVNKVLSDRQLVSLKAIVVAREPKDFPTGVTGKVLKRELRTCHARLLMSVSEMAHL